MQHAHRNHETKISISWSACAIVYAETEQMFAYASLLCMHSNRNEELIKEKILLKLRQLTFPITLISVTLHILGIYYLTQ